MEEHWTWKNIKMKKNKNKKRKLKSAKKFKILFDSF